MINPSKIKVLRNKNDNYLTPISMTEQLLEKLNIDKNSSIFEPCCSIEKTIITALQKQNYNNIHYNIYNDDSDDFLKFDENIKYDYIITNTPYGDWTIINFVNKMKKVATKQVIALYPLAILCGTKKYNKLWNDKEYGLKEVYVFVRPAFLTNEIRTDGKYKTGINQYAWFIWENGFSGQTTLRHIDNTDFVLREKKNKMII